MNGVSRFARLLLSALMCFVLQTALQGQQDESLAPWKTAKYQFGFLMSGSNARPMSDDEASKIQTAHRAHLRKLSEAGTLKGAGPVSTPGDPRGILIYGMETLEEARALAEADPAVRAGVFKAELYSWLGPAGIGDEFKKWKKMHPDAPFDGVPYQLVLALRGPSATTDFTLESGEAAAGQSAFMRKMAGQLVAAGPFLDVDGGEKLGIFVFKAESPQEARALAEQNPAVQAGLLKVEVYSLWLAKGVLEAIEP